MIIHGETYCDNCYLHIGLQKHTVVRVPAGDLHFHDREPHDCWERQEKEHRRYCQLGRQGGRVRLASDPLSQRKAA